MRNRLLEGLDRLQRPDRRLLTAFTVMAVTSLGLGVGYGAVTAVMRAGFWTPGADVAYRLLTAHGVTIFFYWLYFVQAELVLLLALVYTDGAVRISARGLAWIGFVLMGGGFGLGAVVGPAMGVAVLYNAPPQLTPEGGAAVGLFYLGYVLLGIGLLAVAVAAILTALRPKFDGRVDRWSAVSFAAVAWAGLLMVSAVAALNAFVPSAFWAIGLTLPDPHFMIDWNVLFHNVHYLPLMATVVVWYVLIDVLSGVRSIFGQGFSKVVFASYLVFVPPTSLYHMFLEPNMREAVKVAGSLLSLFISVPTVLVFLILAVSLEATARARGMRGVFGWIGGLPWANPAMSAIGMAVVNLALGGMLSFVLIQEKTAPLLSDTLFVPGYFHFLTVGTVTLSFLAILIYVIPGLSGHALWRPRLLARLPYLVTAGVVLFGGSGVVAGYLGMPRRVFEIAYDDAAPALWAPLSTLLGLGAVLMTLALALYVYGLARSLIGSGTAGWKPVADLPRVAWGGGAVGRGNAWFGCLAVGGLVAGMYVLSAIAFETIEALPIVMDGGH